MNVTQAIDHLLKKRAALLAELDEIDGDLQVLNKYADGEQTFETLHAMAPPMAAEQARSVDLRPDAPREPARPTGPQALLRKLMKERPGQVFTSKTAFELLRKEARWSSESQDPVNVVRSALSQLHSAGDLKKLGRGQYTYEPRQLEAGPSSPSPARTPMDPHSVPGDLDLTAPGSMRDPSTPLTT